MPDNKIIHQCSKCSKKYKSNTSLQKHQSKCNIVPTPPPNDQLSSEDSGTDDNQSSVNENTYDINMKFVDGNKVQVEVHKQGEETESVNETEEEGKQVLKDLLRPKISHTFQDEIDKLDSLIEVFKKLPVSDDPAKKDHTIDQLKATITILMTQSQNLIKEMKQMSRRNSYYRNNIMLATFILDKCRKDPPETDEEFETMFD